MILRELIDLQNIMAHNVLESIRVQSEDLREELKELDLWEEKMTALQSSKRKGSKAVVEPPIRGTVTSIKAAVSKAVDEQKKNAAPDSVQIAKEKGNEYFRLNRIEEAIESYTSGIEADSSSSASYILYANRAMCYLKQERWEEAEKDANISVQMNSTYAKGYYRRAVAEKNLGKLKEARRDLEAVLALVPSDAVAKTELEVVTKQIQAEREKQEAAPSKPKKIVIEEVEEEDEEEEMSPDEKEAYQREVRQYREEMERREREAAEARRRIIEAEQQPSQGRMSDRVEVIEEVEEVSPMKPLGPAPVTNTDGAADTRQRSSTSPPRLFTKLRSSLPTKESLKAPKNYSEFERVFSSVERDEELRNYYVSLLRSETMRSLFGCNLTPELLRGILLSIESYSPEQAFDLVKGLSTVNRIEDITFFFNAEEKSTVDRVFQKVKEMGSASEIATMKKKLAPF